MRIFQTKFIKLFNPCIDFSNDDGPPEYCGFDETTGEDKFCCSDTNGQPITENQPPQFPTSSNKPRPCIDHTGYYLSE